MKKIPGEANNKHQRLMLALRADETHSNKQMILQKKNAVLDFTLTKADKTI